MSYLEEKSRVDSLVSKADNHANKAVLFYKAKNYRKAEKLTTKAKIDYSCALQSSRQLEKFYIKPIRMSKQAKDWLVYWKNNKQDLLIEIVSREVFAYGLRTAAVAGIASILLAAALPSYSQLNKEEWLYAQLPVPTDNIPSEMVPYDQDKPKKETAKQTTNLDIIVLSNPDDTNTIEQAVITNPPVAVHNQQKSEQSNKKILQIIKLEQKAAETRPVQDYKTNKKKLEQKVAETELSEEPEDIKEVKSVQDYKPHEVKTKTLEHKAAEKPKYSGNIKPVQDYKTNKAKTLEQKAAETRPVQDYKKHKIKDSEDVKLVKGYKIHKVRWGDRLWNIVKKHGANSTYQIVRKIDETVEKNKDSLPHLEIDDRSVVNGKVVKKADGIKGDRIIPGDLIYIGTVDAEDI